MLLAPASRVCSRLDLSLCAADETLDIADMPDRYEDQDCDDEDDQSGCVMADDYQD